MASSVLVKFVGDASSLKRAATEGGTSLDKFGGQTASLGDRLVGAGHKMTAFATVPIVAGMALATKAAAEEGKEMAVLANTLKNVTGASDAQVAAAEKWITTTQNATGVADGELRPALAKLVMATGDVKTAQDEMGIALDIAAARGKSVEQVTDAMAKAHNGNVGALGRLGIATKDASGETMSLDEILQSAAKTMGGAMAASADTAQGRLNITQRKMADLTEEIGTKAIPVMETFVGAVGTGVDALTSLPKPAQNALLGLAGLAAASGPIMTVVGNVTKLTTKTVEMAHGIDGASRTTVNAFGKLAATGAVVAAVAGVAYEVKRLNDEADELHANLEEISRAADDELVSGFLNLVEVTRRFHGEQKAANERLDFFRAIAQGSYGDAIRLRDALDAAGESTAGFDAILAQEVETQKRVTETQRAGTDALEDGATAFDETGDAAETAAEKFEGHAWQTREVVSAHDRARAAVDETGEAIADLRDEQEQTAAAFEPFGRVAGTSRRARRQGRHGR